MQKHAQANDPNQISLNCRIILTKNSFSLPCNCVITKSLTKCAALSSLVDSNKAATMALKVFAKM